MKNHHNIETETKWGNAVQLKNGKSFREKYRVGYGANGEIYHIKRRGQMWEAQCVNTNVPMGNFILVARTLTDMSEKLSKLEK